MVGYVLEGMITEFQFGYFQNDLSAKDFLKNQDKFLMSSLIDSLLELVSTREDKLKELKNMVNQE